MSDDTLDQAARPPAPSTGEQITLRELLPESGAGVAAGERDDYSVPAQLGALRSTLDQVRDGLTQLEIQLRDGRSMPQAAAQRELSGASGWFFAAALLSTLLVIGVRLYRLDTIQTDLYGDLEIVRTYVNGIRNGNWPFQYVLGVGPLYQYVITPIVALVGLNFYSLKLSAAIVSLGTLLATYALARRLVSDAFALLAVLVAGVSSWLLVFSRLGISLILVPALVTCALWLLVRIVQERRPGDVVACALVSALGLYVYPQSIVLPGVSLATLVCLRLVGHPVSWADVRRFVLVSLLAALPFAWMVYQATDNFFTGYIGSKFAAQSDALGALLRNVVAAALAFHVRGDTISRSNPVALPHLDPISGVLFVAGIVWWLLPARRRWSPVLLLPFVLLHLPSVLVLGRPGEVPSAGRTLGVAPIAYILVASGIWWLVQGLAGLGRRRLGLALGGALFAALLVLNMQRYFGAYINGLPYQDTSIGARIAAYADTLPEQTQIYIVGGAWESAMPELPFVRLVTTRPQNLHSLDPAQLSCEQLATLPAPAVLVWSFRELLPAPQLEPCSQWLPAQLYMSPKQLPVFHAAPLLVEQE